MKKESLKVSPIPLYIFSYSKRYYITHPWKVIKELWIGAKNFYHRGRYGYAWVDLWNTDTYLTSLCGNMLEQLAAKSHGWPQSDEWPEFEDWQKELYALARVIHLLETDWVEDKKWSKSIEFLYNKKNGECIDKYRFTLEEIEQLIQCNGKYERIQKERDFLAHKIFAQLEHMWGGLWD